MQKKVPALRSVHQKKRPAKAAKTGRHYQRKPIADSIAALENTIATERDADRKQQKRSERGKSFREWATVILLFVTAGFVFGQWREMQKVYEPIADQAKATRESYAAVQRAFITNDRVDLRPEDVKDGKPSYWSVHITVQNSGATPTRDLEYATGYYRWPVEIGDPDGFFDVPAQWLRITKGRSTIGPHSRSEIQSPVVFGLVSTNDDPASGMPICVLAGSIRYGDQFAGTSGHITKFCSVVWDSGGSLFVMPCGRWNCSDGDCKSDKPDLDSGMSGAFKELREKPAKP